MKRRVLFWTIGVLAILGVVAGSRVALAQLEPRNTGVPTADVKRGQVDTSVHATGELRATKSEALSAPPSGTQLRILHLKATGSAVKKGDVIVEFDPSEQEYQVEDQKSILEESELEIAKLQAEHAAQKGTDAVDLLTARFDLRKAQLDIQGNELLSAIDARKNELTLEEAKRRLAQLEQDVTSREQSGVAAMAVALEKRNKARITIDQAQRLLAQMQLRATLDGIVAVRENRESNFQFWGMTFTEYREGDSVSSGRPVAEVLDMSQIELSAKVAESERARIVEGQQAEVRLDSIAQERVKARVTMVGGIQANRMFGPAQGPTRRFDVAFRLESVPTSLRPGLTATVVVAGDPLKNVLYIPRQALFDRAGKPTVYVKSGERFEPKDVKVVARTASAVVIDALAEGAQVALADPTEKAGGGTSGAGAPTRMVGTR